MLGEFKETFKVIYLNYESLHGYFSLITEIRNAQ